MKLSARSLVVVAALSSTGCGSSTFQSFLGTLETDLANGTALSDLQSLVVHYFPSLAGQTQAIASVLQAAINLLIASGVLPPGSVSNANTMLVQIRDVLAAPASATPIAPPAPATPDTKAANDEATRIVAEIRADIPRSHTTVLFLNSLRRTLSL